MMIPLYVLTGRKFREGFAVVDEMVHRKVTKLSGENRAATGEIWSPMAVVIRQVLERKPRRHGHREGE
jgi:hypothetical protein